MQAKLQSVKEQIALMRSGPRKKRFPLSLKEEILYLYSASEHPMSLLRELQVNYGSVIMWRKTIKPRVHKKQKGSSFRPVAISTNIPESPRLVLTNGIFIENLSVEFLIKVLSHVIPSR